MSERPFMNLGGIRTVSDFRRQLQEQEIAIPCDVELSTGSDAPLAQPIEAGGITIGNRFAIHPMEGWDGTPEERSSERTVHRWLYFGRSGAKLIWGGEAVAVQHDGRA